MGIPQDVIDAARAVQQQHMPDLATVYRLKPVGTGPGERPKGRESWPDDYIAHLTDIPCRLVAATNRRRLERQAGGQTQGIGEWDIVFEYGTDADRRDRVVVTTQANRLFNLTGQTDGSNSTAHVIEAVEIT